MAVFYSRNPSNYEADVEACKRIALGGDMVILHAHHERDGSLPRATIVPCNAHCRTFYPPPKETDVATE